MRATSRAAQSDARSGSRPQPPPRPPGVRLPPRGPGYVLTGGFSNASSSLANTVELAQACRPTSRAPVAAAAVMMGRRGPGQWAGCEEAAVARDLLPEDGRKWLRCLAGGGERSARGGPGHRGSRGWGLLAAGTRPRPGAGAERAEAPSRDRMGGVQVRSPRAAGPIRRRGGSEGSECWEGLRVTVPWERRAPSAAFGREGWEELSS